MRCNTRKIKRKEPPPNPGLTRQRPRVVSGQRPVQEGHLDTKGEHGWITFGLIYLKISSSTYYSKRNLFFGVPGCHDLCYFTLQKQTYIRQTVPKLQSFCPPQQFHRKPFCRKVCLSHKKRGQQEEKVSTTYGHTRVVERDHVPSTNLYRLTYFSSQNSSQKKKRTTGEGDRSQINK